MENEFTSDEVETLRDYQSKVFAAWTDCKNLHLSDIKKLFAGGNVIISILEVVKKHNEVLFVHILKEALKDEYKNTNKGE